MDTQPSTSNASPKDSSKPAGVSGYMTRSAADGAFAVVELVGGAKRIGEWRAEGRCCAVLSEHIGGVRRVGGDLDEVDQGIWTIGTEDDIRFGLGSTHLAEGFLAVIVRTVDATRCCERCWSRKDGRNKDTEQG